MGKGKTKRRAQHWKPIEIDIENDVSDLISFEELVTYKTIRGKHENTAFIDSDEDPLKKKKDVLSKKRKNTANNDDTSEPAKKKKKRKHKNKSKLKGGSTLAEQIELNQSKENVVDMTAWKEFSLCEPILKALSVNGFVMPTEIQKRTLPEAIGNKKDILGAAETGSGKTLAFAIPIVNSILKAKEETNLEINERLWGLIVTPTRELAIQVTNHIRNLCAFTNIKVQEIVGGLSAEKQTRKLNEKPEIVVGTPGRLWELFKLGNDHLEHMHNVQFFVIDEADRMMEKNHFVEFECLLERIQTGEKSSFCSRQVFVFSATLALVHSAPNYVYRKRKGRQKHQSKITTEKKLFEFVKTLGLKDPAIIDITNQNVIASGVSETCIQCSLDEKDYYLYYILTIHSGKKMIFCNSVTCVKRLHRLLNILQCNAKILFADMEQKQRLKNLDVFCKHPNGLLITTDVAARGLDIADIDYIVHYQVPKTAEIYVHRSGRSVRGVTAVGNSILLCSPAEFYHYNKIIKTLNKESKLPEYNISAPEILSNAKQVINISRKIEHIETKMKKVQANVSSIEKLAKAADILVDDDEMPPKLDDRERKVYSQEIKKLKAELKSVLSRPILPLAESLRYPSFRCDILNSQ